MKFAFIIVIVILVVAIVSTLMLAGKSDENYQESAKRNSINLTLIYVVVILLSIGALGVYIK